MKKYIVIILAVLNVALWVGVSEKEKKGFFYVYFLDVGQGDAILMKTPRGREILIDGGADRKILKRLGEVMPFYDRELDAVFLTHGDRDHVGGLISVLNRFKVKHIFQTPFTIQTKTYERWEKVAEKEKAEVVTLAAGKKIEIDDVTLEILFPFTEARGGGILSNENNNSLVVRATYGDHEILLTGDIEREAEMLLSEKYVRADILKVPHHGSKTSSTDDFLAKVSPVVSVISAGRDNSYGHPHFQTLERLAELSTIRRTDYHGTVTMKSDGEKLLIY